MARHIKWLFSQPIAENQRAVDFDGVTGRMSLTGFKGITGTDPRSIGFWIKIPSSPQQSDTTICYWGQDLTGSLDDGKQNRIRTISAGGNITHLQLFGRNTYVETADQNLGDDAWHHILFRWAGGANSFATAEVWVDAVNRTGDSLDAVNVDTPAETDVILGANDSGLGFTKFFEGRIDNFVVYDTNILDNTIGQLASLANAPDVNPITDVDESGNLIVWLRMGDTLNDSAGAGGTIQDVTTSGFDATTQAGTIIVGDPAPF